MALPSNNHNYIIAYSTPLAKLIILSYTAFMTNGNKLMKKLIADESKTPRLPQTGDLIEGRIIKIGKTALILELGAMGTGIVYGAELRENSSLSKSLEVGQKISALVINPENEDGYVELSLKEANYKKTWAELEESKQNDQTIAVRVTEANRGGLVIEFSGLIGFLPVSQLSPQNYPRVRGGDKSKILSHLNQFVNKEIQVKIISLDKKTDKLVVSEKAAQEKEMKKNLKNYKKGDIVEGIVTALTNFGAFIKFDDNLEGLAHISELDWQIIDHPKQVLQENEKVKVQIIDIQKEQISLSLKALKKDPWQNIEDQLQIGQTVKGKVTKFSPIGALIQINKGIHGLIHLSEFSKQNQQIEDILKIDQSYDFKIISLVPKAHKMSLGLK